MISGSASISRPRVSLAAAFALLAASVIVVSPLRGRASEAPADARSSESGPTLPLPTVRPGGQALPPANPPGAVRLARAQQQSLVEQIDAEQRRLHEAREDAETLEAELARLKQQLDENPPEGTAEKLSTDVQAALDKANVLRQTTEAAQKRIDELEDKASEPRDQAVRSGNGSLLEPIRQAFTPKNMVEWAVTHGPPLITILVVALVLYVLIKVCSRHLVGFMLAAGTRGTIRERENRIVTLVGVFQNVATLVVLGGAVLMLLDEVGIPILPLMGGAAVFGLAVAFGSQNLIKDYFSGFMVLLEDQYGVNDVVKIGDIAGAVEQITLRMTVLRDLEGVLHFIPHGTITTVSNMTHGWSRALLDIGVAYKEDTDRVTEVMLEVARQLRDDPAFGPMIMDDAEMLGVDLLGDSAVSVKMVIKTLPLKRWAVKREYLRRIKHRFDELGIEIPFPQRTVYLRQEEEFKLARLGGESQEP